MNRKRIVKTTLLIAIGMILFLAYSYVMSRYIAGGYSYKYDFLFDRRDRFMDFYNVNGFVFDRNPYVKGTSYPPLALIFSYLFTFLNRHDYLKGVFFIRGNFWGRLSYLILFGTGTIILLRLIYIKFLSEDINKNFKKIELLIISFLILLTAPYIFLLDRGNYLIVAMIFFFIFVFNYGKNDIVASICIAIVAAIKIYPVIFIILFLLDKKIKPFLLSIITGLMTTMLSFAFFKGGYFNNIGLFIKNLRAFTQLGTLPSNWYSVSLKTLIEIPLTGFSNLQPFTGIDSIEKGVLISTQNAKIANIIFILLTVILSLSIIMILKSEKQQWKRVLVITIFMITIPGNSYEYNLVYLIPSLILFLVSKESEKRENIIIGFFVLLLIPKAYHYINGSLIGIQCLLDPLILFMFIIFLLVDRMLVKRGIKLDN